MNSILPRLESLRSACSSASLSRLKPLVFATVLILSIFGVMSDAQAATKISLDTPNVVNVATIYKTEQKTETQVVSELLEAETTVLPQTPGFLNSSILKGEDGTKVVALSQWKDLASFQAYEKQAKDKMIIPSAKTAPRSFVFAVKHTETRGKNLTISEREPIMFSEFKMRNPEKQSELAGIVKQVMPSVMEMIPGLQWAAMAPSEDKTTIALIAKWNSRKDFESLGKNPGFDKETNYWQGYADNEHDIFDVVKIIS